MIGPTTGVSGPSAGEPQRVKTQSPSDAGESRRLQQLDAFMKSNQTPDIKALARALIAADALRA